jgi:O-antigen ligase
VLLVGAVTVAVIGIAKYLLHLDVRASSTVAGYSALATHLAVAIALGLGIRVHSRIFSRRGVDEIFLGIMLVGLALTFSRGQWLAVAVVILLVGVWKSPKMLAAVAAAALGLLMIFPELRLRAMTLLDPLNQSSERLTIWKGAILLFNERPFFGFGLDTFRAVFPLMHEMKDKGVGSWHNDYLQVLVESGLVGLAIFLCLAGVLLYRSLSLYRRLNGTHDQAKGLSLGIFLTFVTFFTAIFFSSILIGPLAFMLFAFIMGLFAVLDEQEKNISKPYEV